MPEVEKLEDQEKIDWTKIHDVADLEEWQDGLFDLTRPEDDIYENRIAEGLSDREVVDAAFWRYFTRGIVLVVGPPRTGKGMFCAYATYKMKRLFSKTIILDYKPRPPFGMYIPFSIPFLIEQIDRIKEIAEVRKTNYQKGDGWYSSRGRVFLQKSVAHLDEFKKYIPRETPNTVVGNALSSLFTVWGHMDMAIFVSCTKERDIAEKALKEVTCKVKPFWVGQPTGYNAFKLQKNGGNINSSLWARYEITMSRWVESKGVTINYGKPVTLWLDGGASVQPGSDVRWVDLYNTKDPKAIRVSKTLRKNQDY